MCDEKIRRRRPRGGTTDAEEDREIALEAEGGGVRS